MQVRGRWYGAGHRFSNSVFTGPELRLPGAGETIAGINLVRLHKLVKDVGRTRCRPHQILYGDIKTGTGFWRRSTGVIIGWQKASEKQVTDNGDVVSWLV